MKHKEFEASLIYDFDERIEDVSLIVPDLGRVIVNLTENALDAVRETEEKLKAQDILFRPSVWISTHLNEETAELRIRDNGGGVPDDLADQIFEPFFTTKPPGTSIGLGLSLSYDIVSSGHNGKLTLENAPGEGATVVVSIPVEQSGPDDEESVEPDGG